MKKWLLMVSASVFSLNAMAHEGWCGYKDYFHLNPDAHPDIYVASVSSDQDVIVQVIGPRSFIIHDNTQCTSGYAHIIVGYDAAHTCNIDIKDGPWMMHPTVNASCKGITYLGTRYDGIGSFSYTIDLV